MKQMTANNPRSLKLVSGIFRMALLLCLAVYTTSTMAQTAHTFTNSSPVTINDEGPANPYPSTINVTSVPNHVTRVVVKIKNFSHSYPDDVGIILVSPTGQKVRLFSDCMGSGGGVGVSNIDLTLDDNAATALPDNPTSTTPSGTYKPRRGTSDGQSPEHPANWAPPAPAGPYAETLSAFNTHNPNGNWQLFADDDGKGDTGIIQGGWELTIYTAPATAANAVINGQVTNAFGSGIFNAQLTLVNSSTGQTTYAYTNLMGYYTLEEQPTGQTYTVSVYAKGYYFNPSSQIINLTENTEVNFAAYQP